MKLVVVLLLLIFTLDSNTLIPPCAKILPRVAYSTIKARMIMIKMIIIMIKIQNFNTLQLENQHGEICVSENILENS